MATGALEMYGEPEPGPGAAWIGRTTFRRATTSAP